MANASSRLKPLVADLIPPRGAVKEGTTPDGKQLYRLKRKRSRSVEKYVMNPKTGKPMEDDFGRPIRETKTDHNGNPYMLAREGKPYEENMLFFLEALPNKSVQLVPYRPPTPEQLAALERQRKIAAMGGGALGEALVDAGITDPREIVQRLGRIEPTQEPEQAVEPEDVAEPKVEFPVDAGDRWYLSDGSDVEGTREQAEAAEALIPKTEEAPSF